ncbi:hypothetical protein QYF61_006883 [Mycteria americana]|nr:hypothetical protein QYF61_006883 [Mycteria americana]
MRATGPGGLRAPRSGPSLQPRPSPSPRPRPGQSGEASRPGRGHVGADTSFRSAASRVGSPRRSAEGADPAPIMLVSKRVKRLLQLVPGKQRFGVYRFLPFFFLLGGAMEWFMINVRIGKETFYDVYRRKRSERQYEARMEKNEF